MMLVQVVRFIPEHYVQMTNRCWRCSSSRCRRQAMADRQYGGDKTEKASAQKLRKAREEGQVVRSRDLATAIGILVSLKLFVFLLPGYLLNPSALFHAGVRAAGQPLARSTTPCPWCWAIQCMLLHENAGAAVRGAAVHRAGGAGAGRLGSQHQALMPKFERLSPATNLGQPVQRQALENFALSVAKAGVLGWVLVHVARSTVGDYIGCKRCR
jgi:flagellar biosynthetic protein FlhB